MACDELLVAGLDVAAVVGVPFAPPDAVVEAVLARLFPWAPGLGRPVSGCWCNGRAPLGGEPQLDPSWYWWSSPTAGVGRPPPPPEQATGLVNREEAPGARNGGRRTQARPPRCEPERRRSARRTGSPRRWCWRRWRGLPAGAVDRRRQRGRARFVRALLMQPAAIRAWAEEFRAGSDGGFQVNLWIPAAAPTRDRAVEDRGCTAFLRRWGVDVAPEAATQHHRTSPPSARPSSTSARW